MNTIRKLLAGFLACALVCALTLPCASAASGFRDVPQGHWAANAITRAVGAGIVQGESKTAFGLGHPMTRAAFAVTLCRFFGWELHTPAVGSYTDNRDASAWYYSAVETAYAHGAVTRQSDRFRPADPITREELAVMLVRSLGYTSIAGLDQGLPCPFADVESNRGYLTMAYYLGIAGGTTATAFSPESPATREQAVVMLMRLYDRFYAKAPERLGAASSEASLGNAPGCAAVAVPAGALTFGGTVTPTLSDVRAGELQAKIRSGGARALAYLTGGADALSGKPQETAAAIAGAVSKGGWDGVAVELSELPQTQRDAFSALAAALRAALGQKLLYVVAEAPRSDGTVYGYDYAKLSAAADRLILRVTAEPLTVSGFPTAPPEPLEEVYYALASLRNPGVDMARLSLWLTTTGSAWTGTSSTGTVSAEKIAQMLSAASVSVHYSARYASAYLVRTVNGSRTVVWYQDAQSAAARAQLCALLDVSSVYLSDLGSVAEYPGGSLLSGLG